MLAADFAQRSGAIPEAIKHLSIARRNEANVEARSDILWRLGHLHYLRQDLATAAPILGLSCEGLRAAGRRGRAWEAELEEMDCLLRLNPGLTADLLARLHEMETTLRSEGESEAYAKALDIEVHALDRKGDVQAIRAKLEEADALSRVGTPRAQCRAHCTLTFHQLYGVPELALASARKAVELAKVHDFAERPIAINRLTFVLSYQGLMASTGGLDLIAEAEAAAALAGDLLLRFLLRHNRGVWHLDSGNYDAAEVSFCEAREIVESGDSEAASVLLDVNCGELNLRLGEISKALECFGRVTSQDPASIPANIALTAEAGLGICELHTGNLRRAVTSPPPGVARSGGTRVRFRPDRSPSSPRP